MTDSPPNPCCYFVYVTTEDESQAMVIGRDVVAARLAACANILPGMTSLYWWGGEVQQGAETVLILKTVSSLIDPLIARVRQLHTYECPCIVALPIAAGAAEYLRWIETETLQTE